MKRTRTFENKFQKCLYFLQKVQKNSKSTIYMQEVPNMQKVPKNAKSLNKAPKMEKIPQTLKKYKN